MDKFFNPESVVVVGVSESPANMGRNIVSNLLEFGFKGVIYQVGRERGTLFSRKIYKSVLEIEDDIDLAVILTPALTVPHIMEECGRKGIRNVIIETAGFGEFGEKGRELEKRIVNIAKKYGVRFIGPNCIGTLSLKAGLATPFVSLKNIFRRGGVSVITQSGGVGFSYLTIFSGEDIGISKFASIGNKLNVDENDLLEYLIKDDETEIICIYLEGISYGRRLMELAQGTNKPILVHKSNIGTHAASIAHSHTAALACDDAVVSAALKQAGIARVEDRETLVNYLKILPLAKMRGNRLAIISRSGGHAVVAADICERVGFDLAPLSREFLKSIEKYFRAHVIKLTNPLDLGDLFDYDVYAQIIEKTLKQKDVDGVVFLHAYFSDTEGKPTRALLSRVEELTREYKKPVGVCLTTDEAEFVKLQDETEYPLFSVPSAVIRAMAASRDFYVGQTGGNPPLVKGGKGRLKIASKIIQACLRQKRNPLLKEGMDIFEAYGIPVVKTVWVKNIAEAVRAAEKIGYPVAIKIVSREILHKTDVGGVRLNIRNEAQLREEYKNIISIVCHDTSFEGVVVQPMLKKGWELILGAKQDANFGPVVMAGLGGIFVEIFKDTSIRIVPFGKSEARDMLAELKGYKILQGARGDKPYDVAAAEGAILKLSRLISDFPEIKEIDINPFYILHKGQGGLSLDARIIL